MHIPTPGAGSCLSQDSLCGNLLRHFTSPHSSQSTTAITPTLGVTILTRGPLIYQFCVLDSLPLHNGHSQKTFSVVEFFRFLHLKCSLFLAFSSYPNYQMTLVKSSSKLAQFRPTRQRAIGCQWIKILAILPIGQYQNHVSLKGHKIECT